MMFVFSGIWIRGSWKLNQDPNFNFQLNRVIIWDGGGTEKQDAGAHCNVGNPKLVLDCITRWIEEVIDYRI